MLSDYEVSQISGLSEQLRVMAEEMSPWMIALTAKNAAQFSTLLQEEYGFDRVEALELTKALLAGGGASSGKAATK